MRSDLLAAERSARQRRAALLALALLGLAAALWMLLPTLLPAADSVPAEPPRATALPAAPPSEPSTPPAPALKTRPLSAWLGDIARDAGRDLVLSPELRGELTASESSGIDWQQRLDSYARVFGFHYSVGDGLIEVRRAEAGERGTTSTPTTSGAVTSTTLRTDGGAAGKDDSAARAGASSTSRGEAGDDDAAAPRERGASRAAPAAQEAPPLPPPRTRVVHLVHASAKETAAVLAKSGEALDVVVSADATSNTVVLSGPNDALSRLLGVVAELDRARRRILLEAKIVEVSRSARLDFGVEWKLSGEVGGEVDFPPNLSDAGSAALLVATGGSSALDARISALEAGGKLRVVSRPRVVMLEGSPAIIESARILRIRLPGRGTVVGEEVVETSSERATEEIPVGVRLEVTPAIRGGSRVLLRIKAKSSSLGAPLPPDDIPEELSRMVDAEVLVTNGETAVLGGLSREAGSKSGAGVPGLHRVPAFGALFGKKASLREEEELLVLVTPRVLD